MDWCGVNYVRTQHKEEWDGLGSLWKPPKTNWPIRPCNQQDIYRSIKFYTVFRRLGSFYPFFNSFMVPMSDEKIGHKINHVPPVDASLPWLMVTLLLALEWKAKDLQYLKSQENSCKTAASSHSACKLFIYTLLVRTTQAKTHRRHIRNVRQTSPFFFCSLSGLFVTTLENLWESTELFGSRKLFKGLKIQIWWTCSQSKEGKCKLDDDSHSINY